MCVYCCPTPTRRLLTISRNVKDTDNLAEADVQMSPNEVVLYGGGTTIAPYAVDPLRECDASVLP